MLTFPTTKGSQIKKNVGIDSGMTKHNPDLVKRIRTVDGIIVPDDAAVLWRYMSYARFEEMIRTSKICFARIDQFTDFREGGFSTATSDRADAEVASQGGAHLAGLIPWINQHMNRKYWYCSCWNCCERESNLLWRAYGAWKPDDEEHFKVAIKTTVSSLISSINRNNLFLGKVKYIDDKCDPFIDYDCTPEGADIYTKQLEYTEEAEVRLAIHEISSMGSGPICHFPETSERIFLDVDLHTLIGDVFVEAVPMNFRKQGKDNSNDMKVQHMRCIMQENERRVEKIKVLLLSRSAHEVSVKLSAIL